MGTLKLKSAPTLSQNCQVQKQQRIATLSLCLTYFHAKLGYAPKIKFVVHNMDYNFYLRSNIKAGIEPKFYLDQSRITIKLRLSFLIHWSIFLAFAQHEPFMTFVVEFI